MEFKISEQDLKDIVKRRANEINSYFRDKNIDSIYFIIILTSSLIFASDLMRELSRLGMKLQTDTIRAKSYKGKTSGELKIKKEDFLQKNLNNKNLLVVDDIYDTGETLYNIQQLILNLYKPNLLEFCCLLNKQIPKKSRKIDVRFIGIEVPDVFIVGYGLDYDGKYREIPYITTIDQIKD